MEISSANVKYSNEFIDVVYDYSTTFVEKANGKLIVSVHKKNASLLLVWKKNYLRISVSDILI